MMCDRLWVQGMIKRKSYYIYGYHHDNTCSPMNWIICVEKFLTDLTFVTSKPYLSKIKLCFMFVIPTMVGANTNDPIDKTKTNSIWSKLLQSDIILFKQVN